MKLWGFTLEGDSGKDEDVGGHDFFLVDVLCAALLTRKCDVQKNCWL